MPKYNPSTAIVQRMDRFECRCAVSMASKRRGRSGCSCAILVPSESPSPSPVSPSAWRKHHLVRRRGNLTGWSSPGPPALSLRFFFSLHSCCPVCLFEVCLLPVRWSLFVCLSVCHPTCLPVGFVSVRHLAFPSLPLFCPYLPSCPPVC